MIATAITVAMRLRLNRSLDTTSTGRRWPGSETGGAVLLTWIDGWVPTDIEGWKLDPDALESVGEQLPPESRPAANLHATALHHIYYMLDSGAWTRSP